MIQIKFIIKGDKVTTKKQIQFCKRHEKDLEIIHGITVEGIDRNNTITLEHIVVICCFIAVNEVRKNTAVDVIQNMLQDEMAKHHNQIRMLCIKWVQMEVVVDRISKKVMEFTLKNN